MPARFGMRVTMLQILQYNAVGKAARRQMREPDIERLQKLADEVLVLKDELQLAGKPSLNPHQMHRFMNTDLGFHALLMRLAANARILKVVNETRLLIRIFAMHHQGHRVSELERIHAQHCDILRAVVEGNAERAMHLIAGHIQSSQKERLEEFDQGERENSLKDSVPVFFDMLAPAAE
jgi:DNA-binding GntR family transcriptional regulator